MIEEERPKLVFLTSPNNPDGSIIAEDELLAILALPVLVVLDEAYIEVPSLNSSSLSVRWKHSTYRAALPADHFQGAFSGNHHYTLTCNVLSRDVYSAEAQMIDVAQLNPKTVLYSYNFSIDRCVTA